MTQVFKNNAFASLAAELSAAGTLATLGTGQGARFPSPTGGNHFLATLILLDGNGAETAWEVVKCTARATDGLTIERAQEGTTARIWPVGSRLEMRVTAGTLDSFTDTEQAAAAAPVQSVFGRAGAIVLQSADVTAALGFTPLDAAQKNAANGIAPLGADSKVPASYLPSYVDDVLEYANTAGFPAIGETAKIYVALDANKTYRWSGSAYVEISPSPGTTDALTEGATNLYFTNARAVSALAGMYLPISGGTLTGNLGFSGNGLRITGDFSNATISNRLMFQTSTVNGATSLWAIPNGTGAYSQLLASNGSDPANSGYGALYVDGNQVGLYSSKIGSGAYLPMAFFTGGSERVRIGTDGKVLVNTTSSDGYNQIQVQTLLGFATTGGYYSEINNNLYYAGGWKNKNQGPASQIVLDGGASNESGIRFLTDTNSIGTPAGSATSLTERMRINANGNVGIGTSSPQCRLDLGSGSSGWIRGYGLYLEDHDGTTGKQYRIYNYGETFAISRHSASSGLGAYEAELLSINSSGGVTIQGGYIGNGKLGIYADSSTAAMYIKNNGGDGYWAFNFANNAGSQVGYVGIGSSSTYYATTSDYRLKTNVQPMQNALTRVAQLKPCTYDWKSDGSAGEGFIAHELQAVVPQCVIGEKDAVDACGNPVYQGVDTSFLVATLVAAIQELKADFDTYKATHP